LSPDRRRSERQYVQAKPAKLLISLFCNNAFDRHYAANLANVRGNWTFPTGAGTAYAHELPRDYERFFGLRVAYSSY